MAKPPSRHVSGLEVFPFCCSLCCCPTEGSEQPPVPPYQLWLSPSATICLLCASINRCYGNGCFQGNG